MIGRHWTHWTPLDGVFTDQQKAIGRIGRLLDALDDYWTAFSFFIKM